VVDEADAVLKASAPAYAMGLVRNDRLTVDDLVALVREVRRDGQIQETELVLPRPDGGMPRTVSARVAPLTSRLVLLLVEDRTRERRVESVRRDFVANVSHELKTPVGAIRLLAEAVQEAADDPEAVQRFASRMHRESERLGRLVQQIIELSRLQHDDPIDEPRPVAVDTVVERAIEAAATDAEARGVAVVRAGETGVQLLGSGDQLAVALSNLVTNAVTYSPDGATVVVAVSTREDRVDIA